MFWTRLGWAQLGVGWSRPGRVRPRGSSGCTDAPLLHSCSAPAALLMDFLPLDVRLHSLSYHSAHLLRLALLCCVFTPALPTSRDSDEERLKRKNIHTERLSLSDHKNQVDEYVSGESTREEENYNGLQPLTCQPSPSPWLSPWPLPSPFLRLSPSPWRRLSPSQLLSSQGCSRGPHR